MARPKATKMLNLLVWKNWLLIIRKPWEMARNLAIPIILICVMVVLRAGIKPEKIEGRTYSSLDVKRKPENFSDYQIEDLSYFPKKYNETMWRLTHKLQILHSTGFATQEEMIKHVTSGTVETRAGISFVEKANVLEIHFHFYTKERWHQNELWVYPRIGIKDHDLAIGSYSPHTPAYYTRGFIYLQSAIVDALYGYKSRLPEVSLARVPVHSFVYDKWITDMFSLTLGFVAIFYFTFQRALLVIVQEKETALKELMLITGLPNFVNWVGYLLLFVMENCIYIVLGLICWTIPISDGSAIFPKTQPAILFLFLFFHAISLSSFGMFISNIFPTTNKINVLGLGLFLILTFPLFSGADFREKTWAQNWAVLAFPPSTLGIAIKTFMVFEDMGLGMQFEYMAYPPGGTAFTATELLLAMCGQILVYMILTLYFEKIMPGEYGAARKWYYPLEGICGDDELPTIDPKANKMDCQQEPPSNAVPGIIMYQLTKMFNDDFVAINNLTTTIYENEITVLLGENGAGKSTIISMLTGMVAPTSGTAVFKNKYDLFRNLKQIRHMTGLCPQKSILYNLLTTREHLEFFGRLKGLKKKDAREQADAYMKRVDMLEKADARAMTLSGGMQRKLNLGIALAGGTQVIFLDEPTAGVDPASRREIWRILQEERATKMIIISTHYMDEADLLADRVLVVHQGELKCAGSTFYLKEKFESTYTLTCFLTNGANVEQVSDSIRRYVPDATIKTRYGLEVAYELSPKSVGSFGDLFRSLETTGDSLGIESFGIELPGMESVFLKITREIEPPTEFKKLSFGSTRLVKGFMLFASRLAALFKKRIFYNWRNPFIWMLQIFLPVVVLGLFLARTDLNLNQPVALKLEMYDQKRVCLLEAQEGTHSKLIHSFKMLLDGKCEVKVVENMVRYVNRLSPLENYEFMRTTLIGAMILRSGLVALVNNEAAQAQPIAVSTIYNTIIRTHLKDAPTLQFVSAPVAYPNYYLDNDGPLNYAILVMLGIVAWTSLFGIVYIHERRTGALMLQFISGYHPICFWFWSLLHDMMIISLALGLLTTAVGFYYGDFEKAGDITLMLLAMCFGTLPLVYLIAANSQDLVKYTMKMVFAGFLGVVVAAIIIGMQEDPDYDRITEAVAGVVTYYNIMSMIVNYIINDDEWITINFICFGATGIFWMIILMLHDMHLMQWVFKLSPFVRTTEERLGKLDPDVQQESNMVDALSEEDIPKKLLVAKHLRRSFKEVTAVKDVTFAMEPGECLGFLGKNGAGKSTTFKLLTGQERILDGDAWVRGFSIKTQLLSTYEYYGYCPQTDPLLDDLKGYEWMEIIAQIRGIPGPYINDISGSLAYELGFHKVAKKKVSSMTPSFKRKLSTALAMIGEPDIVYLDEPTNGMDPSAKRCVWNALTAYREAGKSIILASHSMDECEALCTRMIIMFEGKIEAIATGYQLKQKYSKTGYLVIYIENMFAQDPGNLKALKAALTAQVNGFVVKQEYEGRIECEYNVVEKLSKLYGLLQSIKSQYHIEGYAISNQNSLVSIFLDRTTGQPQ